MARKDDKSFGREDSRPTRVQDSPHRPGETGPFEEVRLDSRDLEPADTGQAQLPSQTFEAELPPATAKPPVAAKPHEPTRLASDAPRPVAPRNLPSEPRTLPSASYEQESRVELMAQLSSGKVEYYRLYLRPDEFVIGRGSSSDWFIDDPSLSRNHARFTWDGTRLFIEDLKSQNGVVVNEKKITAQTQLQSGSMVRLGKVAITVSLKGQPVDPRLIHDEQPTEMVQLPEASTRVKDSATVTRSPADRTYAKVDPSEATAQFGAPKSGAVMFRSDEHALGPEEVTRQWDSAAVLVVVKRKDLERRELFQDIFDGLRRVRRRTIVLSIACVWALGLVVWMWSSDTQQEDFVPPDSPVVAEADTTANDTPDLGTTTIPLPEAEAAQLLASAIGFYDQGRLQEALLAFRRLAQTNRDEAAVFMVHFIERKQKGSR